MKRWCHWKVSPASILPRTDTGDHVSDLIHNGQIAHVEIYSADPAIDNRSHRSGDSLRNSALLRCLATFDHHKQTTSTTASDFQTHLRAFPSGPKHPHLRFFLTRQEAYRYAAKAPTDLDRLPPDVPEALHGSMRTVQRWLAAVQCGAPS